jgi:hypothetical protein
MEGAAHHTKIFFSYHSICSVQTQCFREFVCRTNSKGLQWANLLAVQLIFLPKAQKNKWLNLAIGYGADGMITGNSENSGLFRRKTENDAFI